MKYSTVILAVCFAMASSRVVKRQAGSPPPPSNPPATIANSPSAVPPSASTMDASTPVATATMPSSTIAPVQASTSDAPTAAPTAAPTNATTFAPAPTKIVTADEIIAIFSSVAQSEYFKKLSYEDQLLVMELLTGGTVGKMTAILTQIGYKHLLNFMYDIPLKYVDSFFMLIEQGFEREEMLGN